MYIYELIEDLEEVQLIEGVEYIKGVKCKGGSYRVYYSDFALEPSSGKVLITDLVRYLEDDVIDKTFEMYKVGEYTMDYDSEIYLASYGDTGPLITGIYVEDGVAMLKLEDY